MAKITSEDISKELDAMDIDMPSSVATADLERPDLVTAPRTVSKAHLKELAFMEEKVTFIVGETADRNAENPVPVGVNGVMRFFTRGVEYTEARKFVNCLIKKQDTVDTKNYLDSDQVQQTKILKTPSLKYPLSIVSDPSKDLGRKWFAWQCRNAE